MSQIIFFTQVYDQILRDNLAIQMKIQMQILAICYIIETHISYHGSQQLSLSTFILPKVVAK